MSSAGLKGEEEEGEMFLRISTVKHLSLFLLCCRCRIADSKLYLVLGGGGVVVENYWYVEA